MKVLFYRSPDPDEGANGGTNEGDTSGAGDQGSSGAGDANSSGDAGTSGQEPPAHTEIVKYH